MLHGQVQVFGCTLTPKDSWHVVVSDPRKNMLLDVTNISETPETKEVKCIVTDDHEQLVENVPMNGAVIALLEHKDYTPEEEKYILPRD